MFRSALRFLPNAISIARICAVPVLIVLAFNQAENAFRILLLLAFASDLADGFLARALHVTSKLGALLDSTADLFVLLAALVGIWSFHSVVFIQDGLIIWTGVIFWIAVHVSALVRYGKLASFHTLLARIGVALFCVFLFLLFFVQYWSWLLYLSGSVIILAAIEQLIMIVLVPVWTPDITGGLLQVLREKSRVKKYPTDKHSRMRGA